MLVDPSFRDLIQRGGVEIMKFFPATPKNDNQIGPLKQPEMFGHGLPGHIEVLTKRTQGLAVANV